MGPFSQTKAWLLAGATLVVGVGLSVLPYASLRAPDTAPDTAPERAEPVATAPMSEAPSIPQAAPRVPAPEGVAEDVSELAEGDPSPAEMPGPVFDVVRVAEDGGTLVAGSAAPGAAVVLRLDGTPVAETASDANGQFVAILALEPSDNVQMMTLEMVLADGRAILSEDRVVLTPRAPIVPVLSQMPSGVALRPESLASEGNGLLAVQTAVAPGHEAVMSVLEEGAESLAAAGDHGAPELRAELNDLVTVAPDLVDVQAAPSGESLDAAQTLAPVAPEPARTELLAAADDAPTIEAAETRPMTAEGAPVPEAEAASEPGQSGAEAERTEVTALAAEESPLPRAFVLRGSGAVELLDRAPQVMDNVVIDMIAYSAEGDVQISGRAAQGGAGATLQIYLDNRPVAAGQAASGDWALDLPEIDPGVYTLRVDQVNPEGRVVSRFETPFQREDPAIVAAAQARVAQQVAASVEGAAQIAAVDAGQEPAEEQPGAEDQPREPTPAALTSDAEVAAQSAPFERAEPAPPVGPASQAGSGIAATSSAMQPGGVAPIQGEPGPSTASHSGAARVALVTVQPGHSLWRISDEHYGAGERYVMIYRANRNQIRNPDLIYPGQVLVLPD